MRIFWDSEFTGLHQNTTLISIGLVTEDNRTFYAEFIDYDRKQIDQWLQDNVIHNLLFGSEVEGAKYAMPLHTTKFSMKGDSQVIRDYLTNRLLSLGPGPHEMWGDTLAYDWVLFCELFGGAMSLPDYIYYIPFDLATLFKVKGIDPNINRVNFASMEGIGKAHNALFDARVIKACYERLMSE